MIIGIICAVVIASIAIYQTITVHACRKAMGVMRAIQVKQQRDLELWVLRFESLRAILPLHREAAKRGDARQCNALLAGAVAQANRIGEQV